MCDCLCSFRWHLKSTCPPFRLLASAGLWLWDEASGSCDPAGGFWVMVLQQGSPSYQPGGAGSTGAQVRKPRLLTVLNELDASLWWNILLVLYALWGLFSLNQMHVIMFPVFTGRWLSTVWTAMGNATLKAVRNLWRCTWESEELYCFTGDSLH